jgi:purine-binding chemotaxis protein CheW
MRFGMGESEANKETAIVVVENSDAESVKMVGLLTDAVHEVVELDSSELEAAPRIGSGLSVDYIEGIGRQEGSFVFILNLARILEDEDLNQIEMAVQE